MSTAEQHVMFAEDRLALYEPFRAQLSALVEENARVVFDYTTKAGQDEARSYIYKLRRTKKPVDDARQRAKADSLEYIRKLDGQRNEIIAAIDEMIEQHARPIREAEEREAERLAGHRKVIEFLQSLLPQHGMTAAQIDGLRMQLQAVVVDDSLEEFEADAREAAEHADRVLTTAYADARRREAEEAELAVLRAEKAERDRRDNEERIAREAAAAARAEAGAEAERERLRAAEAERLQRERAERAEAEVQAAKLRAEQAQAEAEARAAQAARDTEERLRLEAEQRAADEARERARREADREHQAAVNREVAAALVEHAAVTAEQARTVVMAIVKQQIPHVRVSY